MIVSGGETVRRGERGASQLTAHSRWIPRWLRRQREDRELARWAAELGWQWTEAADNAQLTRHTTTAAKVPLVLAPQAHSVDLGPPMTLLVEMLPGQMVDDYQAKAERLAAGMGVAMVDVELYDTGWIKVSLLEHDPRT